MNLKTTTFAGLAIALAAVLGATQAQAGSQVRWSVSIAAPLPVYVQSAPVYLEPRPVYVQPRPVYVEPAPVYYGRDYRYPTRWDRDADGIPDRYERHHGRRGDRDRDGVPDRYDRRPENPWRY